MPKRPQAKCSTFLAEGDIVVVVVVFVDIVVVVVDGHCRRQSRHRRRSSTPFRIFFSRQKVFFPETSFLFFPGNGIASSNRKETLEVEIQLDLRL